MVHVFPANLALLRAAKEALELIGAFLRAHLLDESFDQRENKVALADNVRLHAIARPQVALRVNNGLLMRDAAAAGLGIALLPTFLLQIPLKNRTLKVLDVGAEAEGATIYIAYPEHLRSSGKIRALTAWLQRSFGDHLTGMRHLAAIAQEADG
jgi:DNA-binding transcriptional LysR family regulator